MPQEREGESGVVAEAREPFVDNLLCLSGGVEMEISNLAKGVGGLTALLATSDAAQCRTHSAAGCSSHNRPTGGVHTRAAAGSATSDGRREWIEVSQWQRGQGRNQLKGRFLPSITQSSL
jgi:hypothetical protein